MTKPLRFKGYDEKKFIFWGKKTVERRNKTVKTLYWQDENGCFHPSNRKGEQELPLEQINKAPRWFLVIILGAAMALCYITLGFIVKNAFADMERIKGVAWQAKALSDDNQVSIVELKSSVEKINIAQETFRREYREDQKDLDKKLSELLRAVKA